MGASRVIASTGLRILSKTRIPLWVFRLQHRLSITHNELLAVTVAAALLLVGEFARHVFESHARYDDGYYRERDSLFFALTAAVVDEDTLEATAVSPGKPDTALAGALTDTVAANRIDINSASPGELTRLPGIGPTLAQRIVDYRAAKGPFSSVDDLQRVSGIGPRKMEALSPLVTVRR